MLSYNLGMAMGLGCAVVWGGLRMPVRRYWVGLCGWSGVPPIGWVLAAHTSKKAFSFWPLAFFRGA